MKSKFALAGALSLGMLAFGCGSDDDFNSYYNPSGIVTVTASPGGPDATATVTATPFPTDASVIYALSGETGFGGQTLVSFSSAAPQRIVSEVSINNGESELSQNLVSLDFRTDGGLYALGEDGTVYTVDPLTGRSRDVVMDPAPPSVSGRSEIDFNPVVDRLRVVSGNQANARVNVDTGQVLTDSALTYATDDPAAAATPALGGVAYINSLAGATSTTLLGFDWQRSSLVVLPEPNTGVVRTLVSINFGFTPQDTVGFDVAPATNEGFLSVNGSGPDSTRLYSFNPAANPPALVDRGAIGTSYSVIAIAVVPPVSTPTASPTLTPP